MKILFTMLLMLGSGGMALADCPTGEIEKSLTASLEGMKSEERPVTDIQSTEGGIWRIYRGSDGALTTLLRLDGGESGMNERRLSVLNPSTYGISVTRVDYLRHAFIEDAGPNATAGRRTEFFYYCGGKLYLPPEVYATVGDDYAKNGDAARKAMLMDKDVEAFTKLLMR